MDDRARGMLQDLAITAAAVVGRPRRSGDVPVMSDKGSTTGFKQEGNVLMISLVTRFLSLSPMIHKVAGRTKTVDLW